ncbi:MAG: phage holin family protein [Bacteroidales bacterium]|nr:phage holin family protein [Bacteroidales bacterium]MCF8334393.1 phage holin family protein [Bacteroidales bacterium]
MLLRLILNTFAVIITSYLLPGVELKGFFTAVMVAIVIGFLNLFVKPLLLILTIPVTIFTFGIFLLVINALIILMADAIVPGFMVNGFWWALGFSIILTLVNSLLGDQKRE